MFRCSRRAHAQVHIADDAVDGMPFAHGSLFGEDSLYVRAEGRSDRGPADRGEPDPGRVLR